MSRPVNLTRVPLRLSQAHVTPLTSKEVVSEIQSAIAGERTLRIANLNLHGLYVYETDPVFASFTRSADLCLIDGWPVLKLVRSSEHRSPDYRVGSTDWLDELLPSAAGLRIAAIGGTPEASNAAARAIQARYPELEWTPIAGYGLESEASRAVVHEAVATASIVLVGMGMPRQERWIEENSDLLKGKVVANVGGCFDYYAGVQALAPRWMGRFGLEWVYRLANSPRRLAHRYLIEPFKLLTILLLRQVGQR